MAYPELDDAAPADGRTLPGLPAPIPDLEQLVEWHNEWEEATRSPRELMQLDCDYYDGNQWNDEDKQELDDRGQPIITINLVSRKANYLLGEIARKYSDPLALPRTPAHEDGARSLTDGLRYVRDEQKYKRKRTKVAKDIIVAGVGGFVVELEEEPYGKCVKIRRVAWNRAYWDPRSEEDDYSDGRFRGLFVWMDIDEAKAAYTGKEHIIDAAVASASDSGDPSDDKPHRWYNPKTKRVKICEVYFRVGNDYYVAHHTDAEGSGEFLVDPQKTDLIDKRSGYSLCKLALMSCYVDSDNNRYGVVRNLISPQDEVNKRRSAGLYAMLARQVIAGENAIPDPMAFQQALATADGLAKVRDGALKDGEVQVNTAADMGPSNIEMYRESKGEIDSIGPSSSNIPELPAAASGRAVIARQQAASQELEPVFDNLRALDEQVDFLIYSAICAGWTEEKWMRVTDDEELRGYRFVALNRRMTRAQRLQELMQKGAPIRSALETAAGNVAPQVVREARSSAQMMLAQQMQPGAPPPPQEAQQQVILGAIMSHPLMQQEIVDNQADAIDADIVLSEAPDSDIIEQEEFAELAKVMPTVNQTRPDMAPDMVKMLIEASQLRNKRKILERMDKQADPGQQQMQAQMQQMQQQLAQLELALKQAQVVKTQSEAELNQAKAQAEGAGALKDAAQAGQAAAGGPPPAPPRAA